MLAQSRTSERQGPGDKFCSPIFIFSKGKNYGSQEVIQIASNPTAESDRNDQRILFPDY